MSRDKAEIIAYAIRKECQKCYWYETYGITFDEFEEFLSNGIKGSELQIPKKPSKDKYRTIYSRKRGEWLPKPEGRFIYAQCSKCREVSDTASNYCPCCGRLMDINDFNAYIKAELRE